MQMPTMQVYLAGPINQTAYADSSSWRDEVGDRLSQFGFIPRDPMPRAGGAYSQAKGNLDQAAIDQGIAPPSIPAACEKMIDDADVILINLIGLKQLSGGTYGTPYEHAYAWLNRFDGHGLLAKRIVIVADFHSVWFERAHEVHPTLDEAIASITTGSTYLWWVQRLNHLQTIASLQAHIHVMRQAN